MNWWELFALVMMFVQASMAVVTAIMRMDDEAASKTGAFVAFLIEVAFVALWGFALYSGGFFR